VAAARRETLFLCCVFILPKTAFPVKRFFAIFDSQWQFLRFPQSRGSVFVHGYKMQRFMKLM